MTAKIIAVPIFMLISVEGVFNVISNVLSAMGKLICYVLLNVMVQEYSKLNKLYLIEEHVNAKMVLYKEIHNKEHVILVIIPVKSVLKQANQTAALTVFLKDH